MPARALKTRGAIEVQDMEDQGMSKEEIDAHMERFYGVADLQKAILPAGQIAGLIRSIVNVGDVVNFAVHEARTCLTALNALFMEEIR